MTQSGPSGSREEGKVSPSPLRPIKGEGRISPNKHAQSKKAKTDRLALAQSLGGLGGLLLELNLQFGFLGSKFLPFKGHLFLDLNKLLRFCFLLLRNISLLLLKRNEEEEEEDHNMVLEREIERRTDLEFLEFLDYGGFFLLCRLPELNLSRKLGLKGESSTIQSGLILLKLAVFVFLVPNGLLKRLQL